jgi:hypothetical protein
VERTLRWIALAVVIGLLLAILIVMIPMSRNGIQISYSGDVRIVGMPDEIRLRMDEPVRLTMPDGTELTAAFPEGQSIPVAISLVLCPTCGGGMVPARWNLFTGEIEWICPTCNPPSAAP